MLVIIVIVMLTCMQQCHHQRQHHHTIHLYYFLYSLLLIQCISYTQQQNIKPLLHQQQQQHQPAANEDKTLNSKWKNHYAAGTQPQIMTVTTEHQQHRQLAQPDLDEENYTDDNELSFNRGYKAHYDYATARQQSKSNSQTNNYNVNNNLNLKLNNNNDESEEEQDVEEEEEDDDEEYDHKHKVDHVNKEKCAKNCKQNQNISPDLKLTTETNYNNNKKYNKNIHKNKHNNYYTPMSSASLTYHDANEEKLNEALKVVTDDNDEEEEEEDESTTKTISTSTSSLLPVTVTNSNSYSNSISKLKSTHSLPSQMPLKSERNVYSYSHESPAKLSLKALTKTNNKEHQRIHVAHRLQHKEVKTHRETNNYNKQKHYREIQKQKHNKSFNKKNSQNKRSRRETEEEIHSIQPNNESTKAFANQELTTLPIVLTESSAVTAMREESSALYLNESLVKHSLTAVKTKRSHSNVRVPVEVLNKPKESMVIIDDGEEFEGAAEQQREYASMGVIGQDDKSEDYSHNEEPRVLPLRPVLPNPYEDEEMSVVYAEQHSEIRLMCEVDLDIASSMWYKNGQVVHAMDRTTRVTDYRFIKEANGALTITNVMLEDDGKWQCEAENTRHYTENARPVKLVVLDRPKPPYLLIDGRRLDAGNIFVPVKENSELNLACISEGGNPKPTLTWEVLLSPGVDRHAQKVSAEVLELEEIKSEKMFVYSILFLDTPSFAISRTPGFGYPLREGIEVSLKCDVDSNPPSTPRWQKDDGEPPAFCIVFYLNIHTNDSVDVTSEPDDQDISVAAAASHNPNKGQLEVQLGGAVTLQCPQGSLGCWSHLDPVTARLRGLGHGLSTPTGQFSLKDVVYQDAGTYKCIGQSPINKKKLEVLQTVGVTVKGE
ncbi:general transcriptional corepressor trfA [Lucilia cuprina]|uniref:general transcriptional corepressor trfA n=1 Tax=Lucilia cuprina TaxID=7375 RepID=UPI001F055C39|nr:general transcriptional corepressor trfA [Lucilia cuprina]